MIAIPISREAYEAIPRCPRAPTRGLRADGRGNVRLWLDRKFVDRRAQMRGPGESYSDVILRLAGETS